jgi:hypothetical protein
MLILVVDSMTYCRVIHAISRAEVDLQFRILAAKLMPGLGVGYSSPRGFRPFLDGA